MLLFFLLRMYDYVEMPKTKEEFVENAKKLGTEWDIEAVADFDDII